MSDFSTNRRAEPPAPSRLPSQVERPGFFKNSAARACLALLLGCILSARAASLPAQFIEEEIGGTWNEAVGLVFAPDGRMFVWERGGRVWTVENGARSAQPFLDITEEVAVWNNYGMLGFCLHPDFSNNGYIYLLYVADRHHVRFFGTDDYDPGETETHVATIGRITRYTARASDGFRSIDPASRLVLVGDSLTNGFPLVSGQHGVGTILFGSDGTLLASCGDGASSSITDIGNGSGTYYSQALADRIIRPAENIGAYRCQLVDSLNGKIIRIDPATGEGLPSNPFYDPAAPRRPASRVWALGLKTPSRMTLRPGTGEHHASHGDPGVLYIGDVGWNDWEDLHVCDRPGQNFGWPAYEGMEIMPDYYNANVQNFDAPNPLHGSNGCNRPFFYFRELIKQDTLGVPSWPNPCNAAQQIPASIPRFIHARPVIDWGHSGPARVAIYSGSNAATINVGAAGSPVAGASFSGACSMGGVWYTGTDFPATWRNTYFHFDYEAQWIKSFVFNTNNRPVEVRNFSTGSGGVVFVTTHPTEGGLYYITWDSTVRRIRYVAGGNLPPTAVATADRHFGAGPLAVQFTGSNSTDPETLPLSYQWNFGDGSSVSTNASPVHTFEAPVGVPTRYNVTLRVTDRSGATNSTSLAIFVNNTPPAVTILTPTNGTLYPMTNDTRFDCVASVIDAEHGSNQLTWAWQTFLHHNNHLHSEPVDTNQTTSTILSPEGCDGQTYFYRIVLTVTDPLGLSSSNEVRLFPDCPGGTTNAPPGTTNAPPVTTNPPPSGVLDPTKPPGLNFDLSHWYLGTPDAERSLSVPVAELMAGYTSSWFYTGPDGAMVFWAPVNGGTTSGSTFPRSELREQINPPDNSVNWPAFGTHVLEAQCKVKVLPSTGKIIIGQIHGYLGDARPLLKLVFDNGRIDAQVKESPAEDTDLHYYFPNVPLNSLITYRVVLEEGILTFTINGVTQSVDLFENDPEWADQTFYFKAGSYVQDNSGTSAEGGRVDFYQLRSAHATFPPAAPLITRPPASQSAPVGSNTVLSVSAVGGLPLDYQWFKEGVAIPDANQSILSLRNVQLEHGGLYHAVVSNPAGSATSATGLFTVFPNLAVFTLADALETTNLIWSTTGTPAWHGWFGAAHDGVDQAQSGLIADEQTTSMQTTVIGPGLVSFWWKVSSQTNDDFLTFYIGSAQQARISGSVDWQQRSFNVPPGSQVLRWSYAKGEELAAAGDRGWVDEVRFGPQPVAITSQPTNRAVDAGVTLTLNVTATGAPPLSYQWFCDGIPLADGPGLRGAKTNSLTLTNVQPGQTGNYSVIVSNVVGPLSSSNALLSVTPIFPLAEALDTTNLVWTTNGTPPWVGQSLVARDGTDAARSGAIGHGVTASFQATVTGPGTVAFWWRVSSETNNDTLRFYVGSTERARISGEADWRAISLSVPAGSQVLRWSYIKSSGTVRGQDRGWVDQVIYDPLLPPAPPINLSATPVSLSQINLAWGDQATNETGFTVERATNGTTFTQLASVARDATSYTNIDLIAGTAYQYRVRALNAAGNSQWSGVVTAATPSVTSAKINFQPASAPVPPGYAADGGASYGLRGGGLVYGWNSSRTSSATDRNSTRSPDQRHDTFIATSTSTSTRWDMAVPNGLYTVFLVAGDASASSGTVRFSVEGVPAINGTLTSSNRWLSNRVNVNVADGRLSLSNLAGASNNKICFMDIAVVVPLLTCEPDKTVECGRSLGFDKPTASPDPCTGTIVPFVVIGTVTNQTGFCGGTFSVTRTWLASDSCGHSNTCSQTITVVDTTPPSLSCAPARTVEGGSEWDFDAPVVTDSCDNAGVTVAVLGTVTNTTGFCEGTYNATRTWGVTDACGNSNVCFQTVTVIDTVPPTLACPPDNTVEAGSSWDFGAPVMPTDLASGTNVALVILRTMTNSAGHCAGTYTATRTWSATDACGNSNTCAQTLTVIDTMPPVLACGPDKSVEAGSDWAFDAPAPPTDVAAGTNVILTILSTTTNTTGYCEGSFASTRTWRATDACGNTNTCSQTVTVIDSTPPMLDCPPHSTVEAGTDWDFGAPAAPIDLASGTNVVFSILETVTNSTGFCEGAFTATRTWSATDACGNSNTCTQSITVRDTAPPSLSCPVDDTVEAGAAWDFGAPVTSADLGSGTNVILVVLGTTTNSANHCAGTLIATRTWGLTDACGNTNACSQTITVRDSTAPNLGCVPDRAVEAGSDWTFDAPAPPTDVASGTNVILAVLSTTTNTTGFCEGTFAATRTWIAIDACGNSNTCSQTISVADFAPPLLACPADKTVEAGTPWDFDAPRAPVDVGSGTNVSFTVLGTTTNIAGVCAGTFTTTRTWSATDACGNSNACSQTVNVLDTTPPLLSCSDTNTCDPNLVIAPGVTDNADSAPLVVCVRGDGQLLAAPFAAGTNIIVCTATDACTNSATCQFRVIIPPALAVAAPTNQLVCEGGDAAFSASVVEGTALAFLWKLNGAPVPEATNAALVITNVNAAITGLYCVEILGPCETLTFCATLTVTNCAPVAAPVELCSLTQGWLADPAALPLLSNLLASELVLGHPGARSLAITAGDASNLVARLPAHGASGLLTDGNQTLATASLPFNAKERFDNPLLGHAIAVALGARFDPNLALLSLTSEFCTSAGGEIRSHALPNSVLTALADPALGITNVTVAGLLALADRALAGQPTGDATPADLAAALDTVARAFDGCRTLLDCPPGLATAPVNDDFADRLVFTGTVATDPSRVTVLLGHNVGATAEANEPAHASQPATRSAWWQFTPAESGWVRISTVGSSFDTALGVYTGDSLASLTLVAANDDDITLAASLLILVTAGTPHLIAVEGYEGDSGNVILTITEGITP